MIEVLTPTIEGREEWLAEAAASVQFQTLTPARHLVYLDDDRLGPAAARNWLLGECEEPFVAMLDDDDVLYPDHLAVLMAALDATGADLAFSHHDDGPGVERVQTWDEYAMQQMRRGNNLVPVTVLARRGPLLAVGGFNTDAHAEDFDLWTRLLEVGARFVCVPQVTWRYRMHSADQRTWRPR